ncbi:MAG: multicopper oxidase domain-containing protein [Chloroflexi bacterium]|nr:multicopper oxidase domain-containing protein [Chloroflexota bacterium]
MDTMAHPIFSGIRDKFLKVSLFVILALVFLGLACESAPSLAALTPCDGADCLTQPLVLTSVNNSLNATFTVAIKEYSNPYSSDKNCDTQSTSTPLSYCVNRHGESGSLMLRTYGAENPGNEEMVWAFTGPTLRLKRGDTFSLLTKNEIVESDPTPVEDGCDKRLTENPNGATSTLPKLGEAPNCFHGDNVTNVHFHGSHVTPDGTGDNVLIKIKPGESFRNNFEISDSQIPGTHWYHAHKHGSTALQMLNGLAGAFIIEGDFEGIPEIENAAEKVLVLQQIQELPNLLLDKTKVKRSTPPLLVNGKLKPKITMRPGEVQRWRFINATQQTSAQIDEFKFVNAAGEDAGILIRQIAADGIEFLDPQYQNVIRNPKRYLEIDLAPGNRADFLVQAPTTTGIFLLQAPRREGNTKQSGTLSEDSLLKIEVVGEAVDMKFPANLRTFSQLPPGQQRAMKPIAGDSENIVWNRVVKFDQTGKIGDTGSPPKFTIDGKTFDPNRIDQTMVLATAEEWRIENYTQIKHPFHIHVNPFFITHYFDPNTSECDPTNRECSELADDDPLRRWQDTIALPLATTTTEMIDGVPTTVVTPGYVIVRQRYLDFTGTFVLHCHILGHEDRGMMQLLEVVLPKATASP